MGCAARRHGPRQHRWVTVYLFAVRPSFCFCPGTGRRGACGSPSAEPLARLREAGGITPGRFGPFMPVGTPAGADATGVSGAIGTAAAAKGSSKKEASAMAPEPQPRSRACLDFRVETRVAVRCPAAGDEVMGGGMNKGENTCSTRALHTVTVATDRWRVLAPLPPFWGVNQQVYATGSPRSTAPAPVCRHRGDR